MKKKLTAIIAAVAMLVAMVPSMVFADGASLPEPVEGVITLEDGGNYVLTGDVTLDEGTYISVPAGVTATIDLAGYTITGVDNSSKSFALIKISKGNLTIEDSGEEGTITLSAPNDDGWNRSSSTVENNQGTLVVNGGIIEHTGVTKMAFGIDIITNHDYGDASCTIEGGKVSSTYRAIRQFANSTTHTNSLIVNGGEIEGGNAGIWVQGPNTNVNIAELTITDGVIVGEANGSVVVTTNETEVFDLVITGGEFDSDITEYLAEGYAPLIEHYYQGDDFDDMRVWVVEDNDEAAIEAGAVAKIITNGVTKYYKYSGEAEEAAGETGEVVKLAYEISFYAIGPTGVEDLEKSSGIKVPTTYESIGAYLEAEEIEIQEPNPVEGYKFIGWYIADYDDWNCDEDESGEIWTVINLEYSDEKLDLDAELDGDAEYFAAWEKVTDTTTPDGNVNGGDADKENKPDEVGTGDDSNMLIFGIVALVAMIAAAATVFARRREK